MELGIGGYGLGSLRERPTEKRRASRHHEDGENLKDTGCHLHPSCLQCPRPRCIYDPLVKKVE
jgi:hypothetical protein